MLQSIKNLHMCKIMRLDLYHIPSPDRRNRMRSTTKYYPLLAECALAKSRCFWWMWMDPKDQAFIPSQFILPCHLPCFLLIPGVYNVWSFFFFLLIWSVKPTPCMLRMIYRIVRPKLGLKSTWTSHSVPTPFITPVTITLESGGRVWLFPWESRLFPLSSHQT